MYHGSDAGAEVAAGAEAAEATNDSTGRVAAIRDVDFLALLPSFLDRALCNSNSDACKFKFKLPSGPRARPPRWLPGTGKAGLPAGPLKADCTLRDERRNAPTVKINTVSRIFEA